MRMDGSPDPAHVSTSYAERQNLWRAVRAADAGWSPSSSSIGRFESTRVIL